jgi:predicted Zn-dependent protease
LQKNAALLAARHNLGLLLVGIKGREGEGIAAFRENLTTNPDFIASRLSLGEALSKTGETAGAIEQYAYVVNLKPEYTAARVALAGLYLKNNQADLAIAQLGEAAQRDPRNAAIQEMIGDAEKSLGHADAARAAYAAALKLQIEGSDRKRIRAKMTF